MAQSFAHDKLTGAAGTGESESYDLNGNLTAQTVNGQTTHFGWDDEDRLTSILFPDSHTDTFTYNGLGLRLRKSDPTGSYLYFTDGAPPLAGFEGGLMLCVVGTSEREILTRKNQSESLSPGTPR